MEHVCKRMLAHERTQEIVRIAVGSGHTQAKGSDILAMGKHQAGGGT